MTLAGSLSALLETEWSLTQDLHKSKLYFGTGWFSRSEIAKPQVVVTELSNPVGQFFGTATATIHKHFVVNCWLRIPAGAPGSTEETNIESMKREVWRIVNANRHGLSDLDIIVPLDEGVPRHELDATPRILRYEVTMFGVETRS